MQKPTKRAAPARGPAARPWDLEAARLGGQAAAEVRRVEERDAVCLGTLAQRRHERIRL